MGVAFDIVRAWRHPRVIMKQRLADGKREDRALVYLLLACLLMFIAQFPRIWREALADPTLPFDMRIGGALLGWVFFAPLALYLVAAIARIVARIFGGMGNWFSARLALFWALLVASPFWLLNGLVAGQVRYGILPDLTGGIALLVFVIVWVASMIEAEAGHHNQWT